MKPFEITLKNEKIRQYNWIAFFFLLLNLIVCICVAFLSKINSIKLVVIPTSVLIFIVLINNYLVLNNKIKDSRLYIFAVVAIALSWIVIGNLWISAAIFLVGVMYYISKRTLLVIILQDKILYPSFPKKTLAWSDLNNVILKDGLLTIDLKNNRFIQQPVDELKTSVNEQEFNDFCRAQLNK